jgi:hypothetical protein
MGKEELFNSLQIHTKNPDIKYTLTGSWAYGAVSFDYKTFAMIRMDTCIFNMQNLQCELSNIKYELEAFDYIDSKYLKARHEFASVLTGLIRNLKIHNIINDNT